MAEQKPVLNTAGTHVFMTFAESGQEFECPNDPQLIEYFTARGYELTEPRDKSLDGLFDTSTAEGADQTGFDPGKETVKAVNEHLEAHLAAPGEIERVLELEKAGQDRSGVKDPRITDGD